MEKTVNKVTVNSAVTKVTSAKTEADLDVMIMDSVLVSTGVNKNDDVFLPEEVWPVFSTAINKPVNWEHDSSINIGVITESWPMSKTGMAIADHHMPSGNYDIAIKSVIWKLNHPEYASAIKEGHEKNDLFVSMECWFEGYDYLVGADFETGKVVARNDETSILDNFLRSMGGSGEVQGEKISRVLRNITFGGVGVVANPANPDSHILSVAKKTLEERKKQELALSDSTIEKLISGNLIEKTDKINEDELESSENSRLELGETEGNDNKENSMEKSLEILQQRNEELVNENKALSEKVSSFESKDYDTQIEDLNTTIASNATEVEELKSTIAERDEKIVSMEKELEEVTKSFDEAKATIKSHEDEKAWATRLEVITSSFDLSEEKLESLKASILEMDDETFEAWIEDKLSFAASLKKPEVTEAEATEEAPEVEEVEESTEEAEEAKEEAKAEEATEVLEVTEEDDSTDASAVASEREEDKTPSVLVAAQAAADEIFTYRKGEK
jgi:hypothetical protein